MRTSGPRRVKVVHENLKEDAPAYISAPRNDLPLSTDVQRHVFIAGGIGITPFLYRRKHVYSLWQEFLYPVVMTPSYLIASIPGRDVAKRRRDTSSN